MIEDTNQLAETVMQRCEALSRFSEERDRLTRRYLTAPMRPVHEALRGWMQAAGMRVRVDAAGNIVGRRAALDRVVPYRATSLRQGPDPGRVLLLGSHLDTVPNAGAYDGVLGVLMALAAVEALTHRSLPFAVDVVGFSEEEGVRFTKPYLGSRALTGTFEPAWLERRDEAGVSMRGAIEAFGLQPDRIAEAAYDPQDVVGFVEAHLEQGPILEDKGLSVGVVNAIAGQSRMIVRFEGQAGHAGTTPMYPRRDALVSAARLVTETQEYGRSITGLRATVGFMKVHPNVRNVIPASVDLSLDIRHADDAVREAAVQALLEMAQSAGAQDQVGFKVLEIQPQPATAMDNRLTSVMMEAMHKRGREPFDLLSGAGHDAVAMAERFPVAMLFVRHPGGISHHPDEQADQRDVAEGIEVLARFVMGLAQEEGEQL